MDAPRTFPPPQKLSNASPDMISQFEDLEHRVSIRNEKNWKRRIFSRGSSRDFLEFKKPHSLDSPQFAANYQFTTLSLLCTRRTNARCLHVLIKAKSFCLRSSNLNHGDHIIRECGVFIAILNSDFTERFQARSVGKLSAKLFCVRKLFSHLKAEHGGRR